MRFTLNGKTENIPEPMADDPLLWVLRDHFALNGPKFGCGVSVCGACTVHVNGEALRSCVIPAGDVAGKIVSTLEGIGANWPEGLHPVQKAWIEESVPQCGYCQNGQIMTAVALLSAQPNAGQAQIAAALDTVVCRCGTHSRIRKAIANAQKRLRERA